MLVVVCHHCGVRVDPPSWECQACLQGAVALPDGDDDGPDDDDPDATPLVVEEPGGE